MNVQTISREITELPSDLQREVFDFVKFLRSRYRTTTRNMQKKRSPISEEPFIGIWADREDMKDSTQWLLNLRQKHWG